MKSRRQLSKLFNLVLFGISIIFAYFLLQMGSLIIKDIPKVGVKLTINDFINEKALKKIDDQLEIIESKQEMLQLEMNALEARREGIERNIDLEKSNYTAVLASRYVTEDDKTNPRVEIFREKLENERKKLKSANRQISDLALQITTKKNEIRKQNQAKRDIIRKAKKKQEDANRSNTLKAFLIRLAFILPLLGIAYFLFKRYRKSVYWPFVFGWGYFALFAFFVELVPYLPDYGGYVRSTVGVLICLLIGKGVIQKLQAYLEQKRKSELEGEEKRRSKLQEKESSLEVTFGKIAKNICPSCDRKFMDIEYKFCMFCGLCIKRECPQCHKLQISFNQYCLECGAKQAQLPATREAGT